MIQNWIFFGRFIATCVCFLIYAFFFTPIQLREAAAPWDKLSKLRYYILLLLVLSAATLAPSLPYMLLISLGHESATLRQIVSISSGINLILGTTLVFLILTYKLKS